MSQTLDDAKSLLRAVGYGEDRVQDAYPVWLGPELGVQRADSVAFGRSEPKDMSTATVTVSIGDLEGGYRFAQALGSPFLLLVGEVGLDLWVADAAAPKPWRENVVPSDAPALVEWLRPAAALRGKIGLHQLPLFDVPVNLLVAARSKSADRLGPIIATALEETSEALPESRRKDTGQALRLQHRRAARLVVSALTNLVMRDRSDLRHLSATALVKEVSRWFPGSFSWLEHASRREREVLGALVEQLGTDIDYQSLDPAVLSHVYEEALVIEDDRRKLGIYYTPPQLANRVLSELPVELVPPEKRDVLDPACGSGTLLVAAHDRLRDLQPTDWSEDRRHHDLAVHLHGFDVDLFAVEIARLTLLLHAQPAGNGWQIKDENSLSSAQSWGAPSIIVTNPPWKYASEEGRRYQAASDFVSLAVKTLSPGGLLGIVLPLSWLSADNSATVREQMASGLEVFDVWRLPEGTFETSQVASCVLLGRKRDGMGGRGLRLVREVQRPGLKEFLEGGTPKASYVLEDTGPDLWRAVPTPRVRRSVGTLDELAIVLSGQQPKSTIKNRASGVPYLNHFADVSPYGRIEETTLWRVHFPEDFQNARGASILASKKVLVSAARSSANPWQLRVALDVIGVAVRNSMRGVAPRDQDDEDLLYALCILLGSGFANTYAAAFGADRNIPARVLRDMPIPTDAGTIGELSSLGRAAADLADRNDPAIKKVLLEAEFAVWKAYGISKREQTSFIRRLEGRTAPEGVTRYPSPAPAPAAVRSRLRRYGCILGVDGHSVRVWVNGVTDPEGVDVELPPRLPGWMLRAGATFDVYGVDDADDLHAAEYRFQPLSWSDLALDELDPKPIVIDG